MMGKKNGLEISQIAEILMPVHTHTHSLLKDYK